MLIDWFTVVAQAINFIILVWLLKLFLYKPILHAIDEREKGIAAKRTEAETNNAEAKKAHADFLEKSATFDKQRADLLKKATNDAKIEHDQLVEDARNEATSSRAKSQAALDSEFKNIHQEFMSRTQKEVFAVARKALKDLANTDLEGRISEEFVRRIRLVKTPEQKSATEAVIVRSAFDLTPEQRKAIESAIEEKYPVEKGIKFEVVKDLIAGIELTVSGQKTAWSIAAYLDGMQKSVHEVLQ